MGQAVKVSSQLIQKIRKEKSTQWTCSSKIEIERRRASISGLLVSSLPVLRFAVLKNSHAIFFSL